MRRLDTVSAGRLLEEIQSGDAALRDRATLLSVAPIRDYAPEQWGKRAERVADFLNRSFQRDAGPGDLLLALNDTDFLMIQPSRSTAEGVGRGAALLQSCCVYFIGHALEDAIRVSMIAGVEDGVVQAMPITQAQLAAGRAALERATMDESPPWEPFTVSSAKTPPQPIAGMKPGTMEASFYLEPIWNVPAGRVNACQISAVLIHQLDDGERRLVGTAELPHDAVMDITLKQLAFAGDMFAAWHDREVAVALHLPISINALIHSSRRLRVIRALTKLRTANPQYTARLALELTDVDAGLPATRIAEVGSQLKPYCAGLLAAVPAGSGDVTHWKGMGLRGVTLLTQAETPQEQRAVFAYLLKSATRLLAISPVLAVKGVDTPSLMMAALAAGATHISGALISNAVDPAEAPCEFGPEDAYSPLSIREETASTSSKRRATA